MSPPYSSSPVPTSIPPPQSCGSDDSRPQSVNLGPALFEAKEEMPAPPSGSEDDIQSLSPSSVGYFSPTSSHWNVVADVISAHDETSLEEAECLLRLAYARKDIRRTQKMLINSRLKETHVRTQLLRIRAVKVCKTRKELKQKSAPFPLSKPPTRDVTCVHSAVVPGGTLSVILD